MKQKITIAAALLALHFSAKGQLTLSSANFPSISTYNTLDGGNISDFPFGASPNTWDFGSDIMPPKGTLYYLPVTNPFFTASSDAYNTGSRTALNAMLDVENYLVTNSTYFAENGWKIYESGASLAALTGNANDSSYFPEQNHLFEGAREILRFPVTEGYTNHSDSRRVIDFTLTINAYGLDHAPGQLVTHLHRFDTVAAYGQMRVYTPSGPSVYYDVLALKSWQYELDSFYLNGAPAPGSLLGAFGLSQNQNDASDIANRMYFYRANEAAPLLLLYFGSDPFEFYETITVHADNLATASTEEASQDSYQVFLYPNPGTGGNITLEFIGKKVNSVSYKILDLTGKMIYGKTTHSLSGNKISMPEELPNGSYFVEVYDGENNLIANERFIVNR